MPARADSNGSCALQNSSLACQLGPKLSGTVISFVQAAVGICSGTTNLKRFYSLEQLLAFLQLQHDSLLQPAQDALACLTQRLKCGAGLSHIAHDWVGGLWLGDGSTSGASYR